MSDGRINKRCSLAGKSYKQVKKIIVGVIGGTVVVLGIALIVLPGPAFLVIPAGLAILATEFAWARLLLKRAKRAFQRCRAAPSVTKSASPSADPESKPVREPGRLLEGAGSD